MELLAYPRLSTRSKRALQKVTTKWGHPYDYQPRFQLLQRLSQELGLSISETYNQLLQEREFLLSDYEIDIL